MVPWGCCSGPVGSCGQLAELFLSGPPALRSGGLFSKPQLSLGGSPSLPVAPPRPR